MKIKHLPAQQRINAAADFLGRRVRVVIAHPYADKETVDAPLLAVCGSPNGSTAAMIVLDRRAGGAPHRGLSLAIVESIDFAP